MVLHFLMSFESHSFKFVKFTHVSQLFQWGIDKVCNGYDKDNLGGEKYVHLLMKPSVPISSQRECYWPKSKHDKHGVDFKLMTLVLGFPLTRRMLLRPCGQLLALEAAIWNMLSLVKPASGHTVIWSVGRTADGHWRN